MNSTIAFFAGLAIGAVLGFLVTIILFWVAKNYPEFDDPYDEDDIY